MIRPNKLVCIASVCLCAVMMLAGISECLAQEGEVSTSVAKIETIDGVIKTGGGEGSAKLMELLKDPDPNVRYYAAAGLSKAGTSAAVPALREALKDEYYPVQIAAAQAIGKLGDKESAPALIELLKSPYVDVRQSAAAALAQLGDKSAIAPISALMADKYCVVRQSAVQALGTFKDNSCMDALIKGLNDPNPDLQMAAVEALGSLGNEQAIPVMNAVFVGADKRVCTKIIEALPGFNNADAAFPAIALALEDENPGVGNKAREIVDRIKITAVSSNVLTAMKGGSTNAIGLLKSEDPAVRAKAAEALGIVRENLAVPGLIENLKDTDANVRSAAARALAQIPTPGETGGKGIGATRPAGPVATYEKKVLNLEQVADLKLPYGKPHSFAVEGNLAYLANGFGGMDIVDVSEPANARLVRRYLFGQNAFYIRDKANMELAKEGALTQQWLEVRGEIRDVRVLGKYAYIVSHANSWWNWGGGSGFVPGMGSEIMLYILDVSDPRNPVLQGGCKIGDSGGIQARDMCVQGKHVYVALGEFGVRIFDVSDVKRPKQVGRRGRENADTAERETNSCEYVEMALSGKYAYMAHETNGVHVLDISNVEKPKLVAMTEIQGRTKAATLAGNRLFLTGDYGLKVVDVSQYEKGEAALQEEQVILTPSAGLALEGSPGGIAVAGDLAYIASRGAGIQIVNVSNPDNPVLAGKCEGGRPFRISISGSRVFILDEDSGLRVANINEISAGKMAGSYPVGGDGSGLELVGQYAYVAAAAAGLEIVDLASPVHSSGGVPEGRGGFPDSPRVVSSIKTPGTAREVCVQGNYAYIADGEAGLSIVDISKPEAPSLTASIKLKGEPFKETKSEDWGEAWDIHVQGNYAYLSTFYGLIVADVSDPVVPKQVGRYETPKGSFGLWVEGKYAYVLDHRWGMYILDVSDPVNPQFVALCDYAPSGRMRGFKVKVSDGMAYIADQDRGLVVVDVSAPGNPRLLGRCNTGNASDIAVQGKQAFIADRGYGLRVIDVSSPEKPKLSSSYHARDLNINGVEVRGNYAYLADGGGLRVVKIGEAAQRLATAYKFDPEGRDKPLTKPDGSEIMAEEVAVLYGKIKDFGIYVDGIDVCSREYSNGSIDEQLKPVYQDLSDAKGWPGIHVTPGTLAIDPHLGRFKFADGDDDQMGFVNGVEFIWGGGDGGLRIEDNYVHIANNEGTEFIIIDISDPPKPKITSTINTGGFPKESAAYKGYAYVSSGQWLAVMDITIPEKPKYVNRLEFGPVGDVVVSGDHLYIVKGTNMVIMDVSSDPVHPEVLTRFPAGEGFGRILVEDDKAFLRVKEEYHLVDVSDPKGPKLLGKYKEEQTGADLCGKYLYLATKDRLKILDITDGTKPELVGTCIIPRERKEPMDVTVSGQYAYLAGGPKIFVIDISNPTAPLIKGEFHGELNEEPVMGVSPEMGSLYYRGGLKVKDNYIYALVAKYGMWVIDATDISSMKLVATQETAYYAQVRAIDVSNPLEPKELGAFNIYAGHWGWFQRGDRVYRPTQRGLVIMDMSDHKTVKLAGNYKETSFYNNWPYEVDDYLYMICSMSLVILDIHDPARIQLAGKVKIPCFKSDYGVNVCVSGDYAYAVSRGEPEWAFAVIDISDRRHPRVRGTLGMSGGSCMWRGIRVSGNYAYMAAGITGLVVIDIDDPDNPYIVSTCTTTDSAHDVEVRGNYAYINDYFGGIHVIDVSDPRNPFLVDMYAEEISNKEWGDKYLCFPAYQGLGVYGDYGHVSEEFYYGWHVIDIPRSSQAPRGKVTVAGNQR